MAEVFQTLKRGQSLCPKCGKPRYVIERCCDVYAGEQRTFWNYEPTPARIVRVIVGKSARPTWWCADLEGTEREAVEVNYHGDVFYLDNEDGSGWGKVTGGRGGPEWGHSSLPVSKVLPASGMEAATAGETGNTDSTEGDSPVGEAETPNLPPRNPPGSDGEIDV